MLLSIEVDELSRANRTTRRMAETELSGASHNTRLALNQQNEQFQRAAREHQRLARDAVSQAVWDSSA